MCRGFIETEKPEGYRHSLSLQLNGVSTKVTRDVKVKQTTALINRYDVGMISYQEHGLNMAHFKAPETLDTFFEAEVKLGSVTGFNKTEQIDSAHIQGGTGLLTVNEILPYCKTSGTDFRNLGRWSWYLLYSTPKFRTRVVSIYCVGQ